MARRFGFGKAGAKGIDPTNGCIWPGTSCPRQGALAPPLRRSISLRTPAAEPDRECPDGIMSA